VPTMCRTDPTDGDHQRLDVVGLIQKSDFDRDAALARLREQAASLEPQFDFDASPAAAWAANLFQPLRGCT